MIISGELWILYDKKWNGSSFFISAEEPVANGSGGWHDFPAMVVCEDKTVADDLAALFNAEHGMPKRIQLIDCDGTRKGMNINAGQNSDS